MSEQRTVDYTRPCWGHATHAFRWRTRGPKRLAKDGAGNIVKRQTTATLMGHGPLMQERLGVGDDILIRMERGIGRFRVSRIKYLADPPDMWDGVIEAVGYEKEPGVIPCA